MPELSPDDSKQLAAAKALELVTPGIRLGLGTGTTAAHFVALLGAQVAKGLDVICVPTSERTRTLAALYSIPLTTIDASPELDLTVDGADEFDPKLRLIKGGGGALLREKIVAMASKRMIVIADSSKLAAVLGKFPLPVEVNVFGLEATRRMILAAAKACGCDGELCLRKTPGGRAFVSDNGHYIVDCFFGAIPRPEDLADRLAAIPGVAEHGLFIGVAKAVISAGPAGIEIFGQLD
ncbi:MAG TPA: ribose-5-phosphate isomerase RpiA [Methylocella sp.]|jgi:ribose 5-phosphate isomerase A|nr:ribose-5-phosphate isomerase RpiA [Methylocella sp.]